MLISRRLHAIFGVPVDQIGPADIDKVIADRVPENDELDWKSKPYTKSGGAPGMELAKDIAAFANHVGGIIVLGVGAENGEAAKQVPFATSVDELDGVVRQACGNFITPVIGGNGVEVRGVERADGTRYVIIAVDRSRDAPHAVARVDGVDAYPIRSGGTTQWMDANQVAIHFRNRFAALAEVSNRAAVILDEGLSQFVAPADEQAFVVVSCAPSTPGSRPPGKQARDDETGFMNDWLAAGVPTHELGSVDTRRARAAIGRTLFPDVSDPGRRNTTAHIELHHDGAGVAAHTIRSTHSSKVNVPSHLSGHNVEWLASDQLEWAIFTALLLVSDHAASTGARGELELRAQVRTQGHPLVVCTPNHEPSMRRHQYFGNDDIPRIQRPSAQSAVMAMPLSADYRAVAVATYELATPILAEFGIDDPRMFTPDGSITAAGITSDFDWVAKWFKRHTEPPSPATPTPPAV